MTPIRPAKLIEVLGDGNEYALLDVRERARCATGHLLLAINVPLSRLELVIRQYVPRFDCRVVLCDDGEGLAERAAAVLEAAGYRDVRVLQGGVGAWRDAGYEVFRGHYAMTYAFGLYVDAHYATPQISASALKAKMEAGEDLVLIDGRPIGEVGHATIPGARSVPFSELPYRIGDLLADENTPVVVNCGAVTRGILGAETLIEAGIRNPIVALTNGVRGWDFVGYEAEHGCARVAPAASAKALSRSMQAREHLTRQLPVESISPETLSRWQAEHDQRTLYVIDIRSEAEFAHGHLPESISVIGGELVGLYEDFIGTMNARVCLVDDNGARAAVTATWLTRMGWPDVVVLEGGLSGHELITGTPPTTMPGLALKGDDIPAIEADELAAQIANDAAAVIDFSSSGQYAQGHIAGAWWTTRAYLPDNAPLLPQVQMFVAVAADPRMAILAARDLRALTDVPIRVLEGGMDKWRAMGKEVASGMTRIVGSVDDVPIEFLFKPDDDRPTRRAANRRTAEWQYELLEKIERDESFSFPRLAPR